MPQYKHHLKYKYQNEIHCNEIAILPYYIANLNIEATFKQKMGFYEEFKNICFVDTLENMGFSYKDKKGKYQAQQEAVKKHNAKIINPAY